MSLFWYYRPEHTEQGRQDNDAGDEVFASRHKDHNSVACIEDKCFVLTYNEYCRLVRSSGWWTAEIFMQIFILDTDATCDHWKRTSKNNRRWCPGWTSPSAESFRRQPPRNWSCSADACTTSVPSVSSKTRRRSNSAQTYRDFEPGDDWRSSKSNCKTCKFVPYTNGIHGNLIIILLNDIFYWSAWIFYCKVFSQLILFRLLLVYSVYGRLCLILRSGLEQPNNYLLHCCSDLIKFKTPFFRIESSPWLLLILWQERKLFEHEMYSSPVMMNKRWRKL